jgi:hypothetical protein
MLQYTKAATINAAGDPPAVAAMIIAIRILYCRGRTGFPKLKKGRSPWRAKVTNIEGDSFGKRDNPHFYWACRAFRLSRL